MKKLDPLDPCSYKSFLLYSGYAEGGSNSPVVINMEDDNLFDVCDSALEALHVALNSMRRTFIQLINDNDYSSPSLCTVCQKRLEIVDEGSGIGLVYSW